MKTPAKTISVAEACQLFAPPISAGRLRQLIDSGKIPATKPGKSYAILESDVKAFAALERKAGMPVGMFKGQKLGGKPRKVAKGFERFARK